jgi:tRNA-dihydrouridine synthase B
MLPGGEAFRAEMNRLDSCDAQVRAVAAWFDRLADAYRWLPAPVAAANEDYLEQQA